MGTIERESGANSFAFDRDYIIEADFSPVSPPKSMTLETTSGGKVILNKSGTAIFAMNGNTYSLSVFANNNLPEFNDNPGQLFIPFHDLTNGTQTYEHGRYLPVNSPSGGKIILDFNQAINPLSASNQGVSSIIPPAENTLAETIVSGERKYEDRW